MVKKKSIGMAILLSIVTCGIYSIFWFIQLTDDTNDLSGEGGTTGGMAFLFTILTCGIYTLFWNYNIGKKMYTAQVRQGVPATDNSLIYLLLSIFGFGIITYAIVQSDINKIVEGNYGTL